MSETTAPCGCDMKGILPPSLHVIEGHPDPGTAAWSLTPTAADQTPATDSERVDRLREARDLVQEARVSGFTQIDSDTVFAIDDELTRLTALLAEQAATIERVRAVRDKHWGTRNSLLANEINAALGSQRTEGQG